MTTAEVVAAIQAQPALQPGQEGWWRVWGASVSDIRAGDVYTDGGEWEYVAELLPYEDGDARAWVRLRYRNGDGDVLTIGYLHPVRVLRPGTHNHLAASVR